MKRRNKMYGFAMAVFGVAVMAASAVMCPKTNELDFEVLSAFAYMFIGLIFTIIGISKIGR
jgi:hypothetical protein